MGTWRCLIAATLMWMVVPLVCGVEHEAMLVVIGDVGATSARLLIEATDGLSECGEKGGESLLVSVALGSTKGDTVRQTLPVVCGQAAVSVVEGLVPSTVYTGAVSTGDGRAWSLVLRTAALPGTLQDERVDVRVVSCDRWLEDGDDSHWARLASRSAAQVEARENAAFWVTLHIGDQIYADALVADNSTHYDGWDPVLYARLVESFRAMYRRAWTRPLLSAVLRRGAHLMMVDDHDIVNNLDEALVRRSRHLRMVICAGFRAALEYQIALSTDLAGDRPDTSSVLEGEACFERADHCLAPGARGVGTGTLGVRQWGTTGVLMLDLRMARVLHPEAAPFPLVTSAQMEELARVLAAWHDPESGVQEVVVVSPVPLFFYTRPYAWIADAFEKERYPAHADYARDLEHLSTLLFAPDSPVRVLVGGDHHLYAEGEVCVEGAEAPVCLTQVVTSGMTVGSTAASSPTLWWFDLFAVWWNHWSFDVSGESDTPAQVSMHLGRVRIEQNFAELQCSQGHVQVQGFVAPRHPHDALWRRLPVILRWLAAGVVLAVALAVLFPG